MKMIFIRKSFLFCLFLFASKALFSQQVYRPPVFKHSTGTSLEDFLKGKVREEMSVIKIDSCIQQFSSARFSIDENGAISDLSFTRGSDRIADSILSRIIFSTRGFWISARENGKSVKSKPFIIPFALDIRKKCAFNARYIAAANYLSGIHDLLYFDLYPRIQQLECRLLAPLYFTLPE